MKSMSAVGWIAYILIIIGGLNWGLVGFFDFNLVHAIFGTVVSRIIYAIVGLAAIYAIIEAFRCCGKSSGAGA